MQAVQATLHALTLLNYELVAASCKAFYQGRVTREEGSLARDQLLSYPVTLHFDQVLLKRGYELAKKYNRPTAYDAQYLAVTERLSCRLLDSGRVSVQYSQKQVSGYPSAWELEFSEIAA